MKKNWFLSAAWALLVLSGHAQNVGINTDASKPNENAILDIKSGSKGLLIPRMNTDARNRIPNTKGLLVYDNTTDNFWYNTGTEWRCIPNDDDWKKHGQNGDAWLIKGNGNTKDKVNFLGTTNNVPLNIRVNNQPSGRIDSAKGATFWGYKAGAADTAKSNTAVGAFALKSNISGIENTAHGFLALYSNTNGGQNVANGCEALFSNTSGGQNIANGFRSMYSNTTGFINVSSGFWSLYSNTSGAANTAAGAYSMHINTTGSNNTAIGSFALYSNTTGVANTAIGSSAMELNATGIGNVGIGLWTLYATNTGNFNTAVGSQAMLPNRSGNYNAALGYNALYTDTSGSYNTAVGAYADVSSEALTNATALGSGAIVNASNKVRIGNAAVTVIEGQVPFTTPSDGRYKFNVQEDVRGLDFILHLRPVTYQFDVKRFDAGLRQGDGKAVPANYAIQAAYDEASRIRRSGFIAQEVEAAAMATGYDFSGIIRPKTEQDHYSLSYDAFVVPLVKALQEQQQIIKTQQKRLKVQDTRMKLQVTRMEAQDERIDRLEQELETMKKRFFP